MSKGEGAMEMESTVELAEGESIRADRWISGLGIMSRSQFESRRLKIFMKGREIKASRKIKHGDVLFLQWQEAAEPVYAPEKMELDILYEDEGVIVLNKPAGLVVHPGAGNHEGTLVQGLLYYNRHLKDSFQDEVLRPGIVHRLDKDTSGLIITAKNPEALEMLCAQFRSRRTEKYYLAFVKGALPARRGRIEGLIARDEHNRKKFKVHPTRGKHALTLYQVLDSWDGVSLVKLKLETGRTHQIRVHLQSLGCPVLGDPLYSRREKRWENLPLMLHSWTLGIRLPGHEEASRFEAPPPESFNRFYKELEEGPSGAQSLSERLSLL